MSPGPGNTCNVGPIRLRHRDARAVVNLSSDATMFSSPPIKNRACIRIQQLPSDRRTCQAAIEVDTKAAVLDDYL